MRQRRSKKNQKISLKKETPLSAFGIPEAPDEGLDTGHFAMQFGILQIYETFKNNQALLEEPGMRNIYAGLLFAVENFQDYMPACMAISNWATNYMNLLLNAALEDEYIDIVGKEAQLTMLKQMPYDLYLQSNHWQRVRADARNRAGNRCQVCNAEGLLDVHHRTYERRGEELPEDVTVLCRDCHTMFHKNGRLKK